MRNFFLPPKQKFREFADDASEAWALKAEKKEIFVFDRPSQDKSKCAVNIVKLFAEFKNVKPEVLYDALHDAEYRTTWDTGMIEGYNLVHLDANNDVGYYHLKLPTGVANRDFCNQRSWRNFDNKEFIIMNHSEPHERCPPTYAILPFERFNSRKPISPFFVFTIKSKMNITSEAKPLPPLPEVTLLN